MTEDAFWKLIDHARAAGSLDADRRLVALLAKQSPDDIVDFGHHWHAAQDAAYRNDLWAAGYLINGGCSDDGFADFRSWLILQGRAVYETALADPDSLAALPRLEIASTECYPASDALKLAMGSKADVYAAIEAKHGRRVHVDLPDESWDFDDAEAMLERLPNLATKYSGGH